MYFTSFYGACQTGLVFEHLHVTGHYMGRILACFCHFPVSKKFFSGIDLMQRDHDSSAGSLQAEYYYTYQPLLADCVPVVICHRCGGSMVIKKQGDLYNVCCILVMLMVCSRSGQGWGSSIEGRDQFSALPHLPPLKPQTTIIQHSAILQP